MKIGILQTGHVPDQMQAKAPELADLFETLLSDQGFRFARWSVVDMDFPTDVRQADGWLLTGSKHGVYEDHPFLPPLEQFIRDAVAADVPLVGVCFGHQIIAQAMGGRVEKYAKGWAVGRTEYDWEGETLALNAWHQDQVVTRPPGAKPLASNAFCENAALVYDRHAFSVQAHPEFESDWIEGLMAHRGPGVVPDTQLDQARSGLPVANDNARLAAMISRFFKDRVAA